MKKQLLAAITLLSSLNQLTAGLINNTFDTAGNLGNSALNAPRNILNPRGRRGDVENMHMQRHFDNHDEFDNDAEAFQEIY